MPLSAAFAVAAGGAEIAPFLTDQGWRIAFRAMRQLAGAAIAIALAISQVHHLAGRHVLDLSAVFGGIRNEADIDHMALDNFADRRQQRGYIATADPGAAARIKHRLQFLDHKRDIATTPEDGTDHACQADGPGVMLHVLRVD